MNNEAVDGYCGVWWPAKAKGNFLLTLFLIAFLDKKGQREGLKNMQPKNSEILSLIRVRI